MDRRQLPKVKEYLQRREVQERIQQKIVEVRAKATVTISRAAELSGFSENQLRDWEKRGLFVAERTAKQDGKGSSHRQYAQADLERLAILGDLYDQGYAIGELLREAEAIWEIAGILAENQVQVKEDGANIGGLPVDRRVELMNEESAWRYFVSQALRLSLMLICEGIPDTVAGLVLPLYKDLKKEQVPAPANLRDVGPALLGWLEPNQPFCTFLDPAPHFEYDTDFRIHKLMVMDANIPEEDVAQDDTLIVVQRKAKPLTLTPLVVETIRSLLTLVYQKVDKWKPCFDYGMRDWMYHGTKFVGDAVPTDALLKGLTNMVVELGGKTTDGQNRWNFCCILLPKDNTLPLKQRSLVVRAQSDAAPHTLETTVVSPRDENPGLSIKAFQSGHSLYWPDISPEDSMIAYRTKEGPIRSAIAIPISGEGGLSVAVMYITANEAHAFSERDQRLLRMMSRMAEELLAAYAARQWFDRKLTTVVAHPELVDPAFKGLLSEGDFIRDVDALLVSIKEKIREWKKTTRRENVSLAERKARYEEERLSNEVVSFIAIDVDNQSSLANRYGDHATRDLSSEIGSRIQKQLISIAKNPEDCHLYHASADRFCLILQEMPLEEVQTKAEHLRQVLEGAYHIDVRRTSSARANLPQDTVELTRITVRVAVSWFSFRKLEEVLQRYDPLSAVTEVRKLIIDNLDEMFILGQREGGNAVISWDPINWGYERYSPSKHT